ncbi:MAG TPA: M48 family metallopeptidase [Bacteroidales bacterium]|nr:M48 family metallopeptidase [Bacteroidales bacterium]HRW94723.1 M48 family metallopeptidase [Bacteroidales bacterium]
MGICKAGDIVFTLYRSTRKSLGIAVRKDGTVHVRAPFWISSREVIRVVSSKATWIQARQKALEKEPCLPSDKKELEQLRKEALVKFLDMAAPWVEHFNKKYGVKPEKWTVRTMNTRWGSCSSATGRITLNLKLFFKPDPCVEYVIVHELCHLIHPDHGKGFYDLLERELPDWKHRRKQLKA